MKAIFTKSLLIIGFISVSLALFSQCEIKNRILPDGSLSYYIDPVNFYWTESKDLKGGLVTDREHYFLSLQPKPFPEKSLGQKLKDDIEMILSDNNLYILKHYDTRYLENDSVMQMLYMIDKKDLESFLNFEAVSVKINMGGDEGDRSYVFKLHKSALMEQLACFLKEEENKK